MARASSVDVRAFEKSLRALAREWDAPALAEEGKFLSMQMIKFAKNAPIPRGRYAEGGGLAGSDVVEVRSVQKGKGVSLRFGFNRIYAAFQDAGDRSGSITILPRRKKALFIPLSAAARKHVYGANPTDEGLKWGIDYVLAKKAVIPIKGYGSPVGPNRFFSGTLKAKSKWFIEELGRLLGERAGKAIRADQQARGFGQGG